MVVNSLEAVAGSFNARAETVADKPMFSTRSNDIGVSSRERLLRVAQEPDGSSLISSADRTVVC